MAPLPEFPSIWRLLPHRVVVKDKNGRPHTLGWMESFQHGDLSRFLLTFEWQTLQKMVLQEGEKLLLRGLETLANQSVFALVHVLGSIVVRFVFAWLEEGLFPVFSKLLVQASSLPIGDTHKQTLYQKASIILALLTKLMTYIGLVFASFGFNYAYLLLDLLYTSKYSNTTAPEVLGWYCVYILAMGVNGITEAFAHAAAPPSTLVFFNIAMVFQSILFVASSVVFLKSGFAAGIIMASVVVMASRILVSFFFICNFFRDHVSANAFQIGHFLPHPLVIIMFAISFSVTHLTQLGLCSPGLKVQIFPCAQHVFAGGLCLLITSAVAFLLERRYFRELISFIKTRDV
jgi:oligosaccharide translocation protein RFT1